MRKERKELLIGAAAVVACLLLIGVLLDAVCARAAEAPRREDFTPVRVAVRDGETAWSIASRYCPEGVDVREYLGWCADENGLDGMGRVEAGRTYIFLEVKR